MERSSYIMIFAFSWSRIGDICWNLNTFILPSIKNSWCHIKIFKKRQMRVLLAYNPGVNGLVTQRSKRLEIFLNVLET